MPLAIIECLVRWPSHTCCVKDSHSNGWPGALMVAPVEGEVLFAVCLNANCISLCHARCNCSQADDDSAPDLWLQLLEHCAATICCQPGLIQGLGRQIMEQRREFQSMRLRDAGYQQQASTQQHLITQLQRDVRQLQQENQQLQQQAAEAVELRVRACGGP